MAEELKQVIKPSEIISNISERFSEFREDVRKSLREAWEGIVNQVVNTANELLDRLTGKESSVVLNLDSMGLDLGAGRRISTSGTIKLSVALLK